MPNGPTERDECRYLRALLDAADVAILVADDDAVWVDANKAACRLLGMSREEIIGRRLSDVADPSRAREVRAQWAAFLRDGSQSGVFELHLADGTVRGVRFQARANFVPGFHCSFMTPIPEAHEEVDGELLQVCAWSKRVRDGERWVSLEEYLQRRLGIRVTHGLSPEALEDLGGDI